MSEIIASELDFDGAKVVEDLNRIVVNLVSSLLFHRELDVASWLACADTFAHC